MSARVLSRTMTASSRNVLKKTSRTASVVTSLLLKGARSFSSTRSNYYNTLSQKAKLEQLAKCRFMERSEFAEGKAKLRAQRYPMFSTTPTTTHLRTTTTNHNTRLRCQCDPWEKNCDCRLRCSGFEPRVKHERFWMRCELRTASRGKCLFNQHSISPPRIFKFLLLHACVS